MSADEELARAIARGLYATWQRLPAQHPHAFEELVRGVLAGMRAERRGMRAELEAVRREARAGTPALPTSSSTS